MKRTPYEGRHPDERYDILQTLIAEWERDWNESFGKNPDGSQVWQVNACDVALLIDEIQRLQTLLNGRDDFIVKQGLWQDFADQLPGSILRNSRAGGP